MLKDFYAFLRENNIQLEDGLILTLDCVGPNGKRIYSNINLVEECRHYDEFYMLIEQVLSALKYAIEKKMFESKPKFKTPELKTQK